MKYSKFKLFARMGAKLLFPPQTKKLANYALYRTLMPLIRRWGPDKLLFSPINVIISVTSRCNKQCSFCYFNRELNTRNAEQLELTYERFLDIINHPLVVNASRIAFSGGEPLLNKDIFKMIAEAKRRRHIVTVITNGILLEKLSCELIDNPPDMLTVTYYPEDRERLETSLSIFTEKMPTKLDFILSRDSLPELGNMLKLAVAANVCFVDIENLVIPVGSDEQPLYENDAELLSLKTRLNKQYGSKVPINWRRPLLATNKDKSLKCLVFWHSLHVDAKGRISPCCQWPLSTYQDNIFENTHAWNSEHMISLRKLIRKGKIPDYCRGCSALYEDYLGI